MTGICCEIRIATPDATHCFTTVLLVLYIQGALNLSALNISVFRNVSSRNWYVT